MRLVCVVVVVVVAGVVAAVVVVVVVVDGTVAVAIVVAAVLCTRVKSIERNRKKFLSIEIKNAPRQCFVSIEETCHNKACWPR